MAFFYTADLHLGHSNIIRHCARPFPTVEAMDAAIIGNWNAVVGPEDTVFVIGDFAWKDRADAYLRRLMGRVVLIRGNHDLPKWTDGAGFAEIHELLELKGQPRKDMTTVMCHYPLATWNHSRRGASCMLHGHEHGRLPSIPGRLDVGVDVHDFRPLAMAEVETLIERTRRGA